MRPSAELRAYIGLASSILHPEAITSPPVLAAPRSPEDTRVRRFVVGRKFTDQQRVAHLKELVRLVARQYALPLPRLAVRFTDLKHAAGRIRRSEGTWYVDVAHDFRDHDRQLLTTVAHEMAHVVLLSAGVALPTLEANERLTDTTAALAGFAHLMQQAKRAIRQEKLRFGLSRNVHLKVGYLDVHELWQVGRAREVIREQTPVRLYGPILPGERIACWSCGRPMEPGRAARLLLTCPTCRTLHGVTIAETRPLSVRESAGRWLDQRRGLILPGGSP